MQGEEKALYDKRTAAIMSHSCRLKDCLESTIFTCVLKVVGKARVSWVSHGRVCIWFSKQVPEFRKQMNVSGSCVVTGSLFPILPVWLYFSLSLLSSLLKVPLPPGYVLLLSSSAFGFPSFLPLRVLTIILFCFCRLFCFFQLTQCCLPFPFFNPLSPACLLPLVLVLWFPLPRGEKKTVPVVLFIMCRTPLSPCPA